MRLRGAEELGAKEDGALEARRRVSTDVSVAVEFLECAADGDVVETTAGPPASIKRVELWPEAIERVPATEDAAHGGRRRARGGSTPLEGRSEGFEGRSGLARAPLVGPSFDSLSVTQVITADGRLFWRETTYRRPASEVRDG